MTAGILDVCSLVLTSAFFIGVILGTALVARKCQALIDATKASLEERGWIVDGAHSSSSSSSQREDGTGSVVVVKMSKKKKMDHERYLDATQRGVIKALNASTFGAPSSQNRIQIQTTANASGPSSLSSMASFAGSTFTHFRSQLLLPPFAPAPTPTPTPTPTSPPAPQPDRLRRVESAASGGQGRSVLASSSLGAVPVSPVSALAVMVIRLRVKVVVLVILSMIWPIGCQRGHRRKSRK
ncbi:hypothetical protein BGY98DRAFT_69375 [Russula aff. rugulosa BPL654]|nr:hypothetical protein BGY98DRAFT_69375 [Russula aff. rugulosa BPL654]